MNIPKQYWLELGAAAIIFVLLLALGFQTVRLHASQNETVAMENAFNHYKIDQQAEIVRVSAEAAKKLQEQIERDNEQIESLQVVIGNAQSELGDTSNELKRVRRELTRIRQAGNTATTSDCTATANTGLLLADMFGECTERLTEVAGVADRRGLAGQSCIRAYQTISEVINGG